VSDKRIRRVRHGVWLVWLAPLALALPMLACAQRCPQGQYYDTDHERCAFPAPNIVNELWNAIAFAPSHSVAAFAGSFTAPENAKAAALKACQARASDCRIVVAAHDVCVAVAYERKPLGTFRAATGATRDGARGNALGICKDEGPQRCAVMSGCSGQPPILSVTP
jgi:Domain of unknown function (DUF4189)